jgi:hypothetical protein
MKAVTGFFFIFFLYFKKAYLSKYKKNIKICWQDKKLWGGGFVI